MLGDNIKRIRLSKGIGLNEAARLANISGGYLSSIENNKRTNIGTEILDAIANAIGVSVDEFFKDDTTTEEKPIDKINKLVEDSGINTIAAHFEGEEFTEDDKEDIENFIKYVLSKKKKNK
ncbi:helix-turn-helix domain-containing protein [Clostridium tyrobutyricum]|uniref:helix-turn-helix domain-containing protein n=1 Tax=Clostridium tyrobutyricum TaxID=1519 RepID=UPI001C3915BD|nr:helix-turn-helix transcriptional regulator [Clostridium tyrobutyricum]MBV4417433.1 helix-turn-helix transcriptional regulator [Clostridium tyrobutyricum]